MNEDKEEEQYVDLFDYILVHAEEAIFDDDPDRCGEKVLEGIQMAWIEERQ